MLWTEHSETYAHHPATNYNQHKQQHQVLTVIIKYQLWQWQADVTKISYHLNLDLNKGVKHHFFCPVLTVHCHNKQSFWSSGLLAQVRNKWSPMLPVYTPWAIKNVALYFGPYLRQLLTDIQNSFTDTLCEQSAIMQYYLFHSNPGRSICTTWC